MNMLGGVIAAVLMALALIWAIHGICKQIESGGDDES